MGRGRVQLKRIENKINRQVTFSKRRSGLLKKAHEISVLCDAEVALVIFSSKGRLYEYSTNSSMDRILQRYENNCCTEKEFLTVDPCLQGTWSMEYNKLKSKIETLEKSQRQTLGEEIDSLDMKELHDLEHKLENGLKQIRSKKNNLLSESILELQRKEKELQKHNRDLQKKLKEKEDSNASSLGPCTDPEPLDPKGNSDGLSAMTYEGDSLPTLNIGVYANSPSDEVRQSTGMQAGTSCVLLPWMLPRVNS